MSSRRIYLRNLSQIPARSKAVSNDTSVVIFDRKLLKSVPGFSTFIKKFRYAYPVSAGENLKSFDEFKKLALKIHKDVSGEVNRRWSVVAIGGGSVGDAAGFFASVYKRGLRLVHVPTTWLSAIDSSHGGKTALNLKGAKNQIGTFYEAEETILVQSVLMALSENHRIDAYGEFTKIALLDRKVKITSQDGEVSSEFLWSRLPKAIDAKLKIVASDPFETRGHRQLLNLGHTMGHVFEMELGLSHGRSVGLGLLFAIDVSHSVGVLSQTRATHLREWLSGFGISKKKLRTVSSVKAERLLRQDKKKSPSDRLNFIIIRDVGWCERREMSVMEVIEIGRQTGWLK